MTTGSPAPGHAVLLPEGSRPARLVVCEISGQWAAALRRALGAGAPRVIEVRSLDDCLEVLRARPASFVVAELTRANPGPLVDALARIERECPLARVAVVAGRALGACEWLVREAGAVHFEVSPRRLGPLAETVRRHLAQAPRPALGLAGRIWARLPWRAPAVAPRKNEQTTRQE